MHIQSVSTLYIQSYLYSHALPRSHGVHAFNITTVLCRPNITENQKIAQARVKVAEEWANTLKQQERPPTEDMPHL